MDLIAGRHRTDGSDEAMALATPGWVARADSLSRPSDKTFRPMRRNPGTWKEIGPTSS